MHWSIPGPAQNWVSVRDDWSDLEETLQDLTADPAKAKRIADSSVGTLAGPIPDAGGRGMLLVQADRRVCVGQSRAGFLRERIARRGEARRFPPWL